jgi:hypothetical protein
MLDNPTLFVWQTTQLSAIAKVLHTPGHRLPYNNYGQNRRKETYQTLWDYLKNSISVV